jgi:hypothetical protein
MKLKTTTKQAFERARATDSCVDLVLLGTESARDLFPILRQEPKTYTSETHSFSSVFGFDCKFYYRLEKYTINNILTDVEIGVGCITKENDLTIFKRLQSIVYKHRDQDFVPVRMPVDIFRETNSQEYVVLFSHIPTTLSELLVEPNSLVVSAENNPISTIKIENNSVLGRLENDAQSISLDQLSDKTRELITSYSKQIVLGCSQLDVKKLKTNSLQLKPCNRPQSKEGTLTYNETTKALEYYDGEQWRILQWKVATDS